MISNIDSKNNKLTREQISYFKDTVVKDEQNRLLVCYHGSGIEFPNFNSPINWFTVNKEYADQFAFWYLNSDERVIYKVYLNITNVLDCGNTDGLVFSNGKYSEDFIKLMNKINLSNIDDLIEEVIEERKEYIDTTEEDYKKKLNIFTVVRTKAFKSIAVELGYNGLKTIEENNYICYATFNSNQSKSIWNTTPTESNKLKENMASRRSNLTYNSFLFGESINTNYDAINSLERLNEEEESLELNAKKLFENDEWEVWKAYDYEALDQLWNKRDDDHTKVHEYNYDEDSYITVNKKYPEEDYILNFYYENVLSNYTGYKYSIADWFKERDDSVIEEFFKKLLINKQEKLELESLLIMTDFECLDENNEFYSLVEDQLDDMFPLTYNLDDGDIEGSDFREDFLHDCFWDDVWANFDYSSGYSVDDYAPAVRDISERSEQELINEYNLTKQDLLNIIDNKYDDTRMSTLTFDDEDNIETEEELPEVRRYYNEDEQDTIKYCIFSSGEFASKQGAVDSCMEDFNNAINSSMPTGVTILENYFETNNGTIKVEITKEFVKEHKDEIEYNLDYYSEDLNICVIQTFREVFSNNFNRGFSEPYLGWYGFSQDTFEDNLINSELYENL